MARDETEFVDEMVEAYYAIIVSKRDDGFSLDKNMFSGLADPASARCCAASLVNSKAI